jgi:hypothetical protein
MSVIYAMVGCQKVKGLEAAMFSVREGQEYSLPSLAMYFLSICLIFGERVPGQELRLIQKEFLESSG